MGKDPKPDLRSERFQRLLTVLPNRIKTGPQRIGVLLDRVYALQLKQRFQNNIQRLREFIQLRLHDRSKLRSERRQLLIHLYRNNSPYK